MATFPKHIALAIALALTGLLAAVYFPVLLGDTWFLDVYLTEIHPHHVLIGKALEAGEFPIWTQQLMMGYPLSYNPQVGAFYPFHALFLLVADAHIVLSWSVFIHGILSGLGMFFLTHMAGGSREGSLTAALLYPLSPFMVFYHQAIHGYIALAWMPWAIAFTWKFVRTSNRRWLVAASTVVALQMYAGHLQFVMYTLVLMGVFSLVGASAQTLTDRFRRFGWTVISGVLALCIYAPQLAASYTLWSHSLRKQLHPANITQSINIESLGLDDLVELVLPQFFGGPSFRDFWYPEFIGIGVLLAIAMARRSSPRFLRWTCGGAILYLIAVQVPGLGNVIASIPGLSAFRAPGRIICWLLLLGTLLAGLGLEPLLGWLSTKYGRITTGLLALAGLSIGCGAFDSVSGRDPELPTAVLQHIRSADGWMLLATAAGLLGCSVIHSKNQPIARWALISCLILPLLDVSTRYTPSVSIQEEPPFLSILRGAKPRRLLGIATGDPNYLASVPGPYGWPHNAAGDPVKASWSLHANVGAVHGFSNLHAQTSLPLRRVTQRLFGDLGPLDYPFVKHPRYHTDLLSHVGVTHVVSRRDGQNPITPRPSAIGERDGYSILQLPRPRPAARFYPDAGILTHNDESSALRATRRTPAHNNQPIEWPLVVEGYSPTASTMIANQSNNQPLPVSVISSKNGHVHLKVTAKTSGVVLYTEAWFPDWTAYVDGEQVEITIADGCFIGIPVTAGTHDIELRFVPQAYFSGFPIVGIGIVGLLLLGWRRRPRTEL